MEHVYSTATESPTTQPDPTHATAAQLARAIANGTMRSCDVVAAHVERIRAVNPRLNAVVLERFDEARREAQEADRRVRTGGSLPPLLGVPITLKECIDLAGTPSTFGIDGRRALAASDAPAVRRLRDAGAIVLAKTNVAQHLMFFETDNPVFGRTHHPASAERSCGGSSGGEAALIASFASPLGIGTDLGGSVRNPAALCGLASFKPTAGRLVDEGTGSAPTGQELITSQVGSLARTVDDVAIGVRVAMGDGDDGRGPLASLEDVDVGKLRVAMMEDDGVFAACPAARRAVREARDRLVELGARAVDVSLPSRRRAHEIFFEVMSADRASHMTAVLRGSRVDPRIRQLVDSSTKPRPLVNLLLGLTGRKEILAIVRHFGDGTAASYFALVDEVRAMRRQALAAMQGADVVLTPPCPLPAYRHGACLEVGTLGTYTTYWNVLGWPAGVVPWTTVRADEESDRPPSKDPCHVAAREAERGSAGLPIGVQIAAAPHRDHVVLAALRALEFCSVSETLDWGTH
ncbi:MAG TPA: amidase family protein [Polyangiaceae bacterium]|nr:amidase family protein [Polyangiaceae bacterium]